MTEHGAISEGRSAVFALRFLLYALALIGLLLYLARGIGVATPTIPTSNTSAIISTRADLHTLLPHDGRAAARRGVVLPHRITT